jgi:hypothetical protein
LVYRKHVKEQNYENESMDKKLWLWLVSIAYKDYRWLQFIFLLSLLNNDDWMTTLKVWSTDSIDFLANWFKCMNLGSGLSNYY